MKSTGVLILLGLIGATLYFPSCTDKDDLKPFDSNDLTSIPYSPEFTTIKKPNRYYPEMVIPADNPLTKQGIALGRMLFYDPILAKDSSMSCASCHRQEFAFSEDRPFSVGIDGKSGRRSSMSLVDIGYANHGVFWDGRSKTLESQALLPVEDPIELHHTWPELITKLQKHPIYPEHFRKAFGISSKVEITKELAAKAIAQFERTILSSGNSPFERKFINRTEDPTDDELAGHDMYVNSDLSLPDAQCGHCHNAPMFGTHDFFNNGLQKGDPASYKDKGMGEVTNQPKDFGKFKAPTLRNIAVTAPYMHNGSIANLDQVMDHYISGGNFSNNIDPLVTQIQLSPRQKAQVIAFLNTLTDFDLLQNKELSNPFK
jgi:cytochrome c peroxidase